MAVITISRQFGSGGDEIAAKVCYMLEYLYFDKQLMLQVAADMGLSEYEVVDFSEDTYKMRGFVDRVLSWRGPRMVARVDTWKQEPTGTVTKEVIELDEANSVAFAQKNNYGRLRL
jgi:cytidylate kinase